MTWKKTRRIISVIVFIALFLLLFQWTTRILQLKSKSINDTASFYEEPEDTVDVLFFGSSHLYYSVYPMKFWEDYGVTSYVLGSPQQSLGSSYYLMKDAIKRQHPDVVVVEAYGTYIEEKYKDEGMQHRLMDGMPLSLNKIQMGEDLLDDLTFGERLPYYLPIIQYHSRWSELGYSDRVIEDSYEKGGKLTFLQKPQKAPEIVGEKGEIPENSMYYIEKIIDLCQETNTQLMVCLVPYAGTKSGNLYVPQQKMFVTLEEYMKEREIPFLNYASLTEEIGLDYTTDFRDVAHLNVLGAQKVDDHLFSYLMNNFQISTHKGDKEYDSWNKCLKKYKKERDEGLEMLSRGEEVEEKDAMDE